MTDQYPIIYVSVQVSKIIFQTKPETAGDLLLPIHELLFTECINWVTSECVGYLYSSTSLNMHTTIITTAIDCTLPIARLARLIKEHSNRIKYELLT